MYIIKDDSGEALVALWSVTGLRIHEFNRGGRSSKIAAIWTIEIHMNHSNDSVYLEYKKQKDAQRAYAKLCKKLLDHKKQEDIW